MKISVFDTLYTQFMSVWRGVSSIWRMIQAVVPYWFGIGEHRKRVTELYPDPVSSRTEDDLPSRSRGFLFNDIEKCTGCGDCKSICPTFCIELDSEPGPETNKPWVSRFDIDFGKCIFCGLCVSVCQPGSLTHSRQFEGAVYSAEDLILKFGGGAVSESQRLRWEKMRKEEEFF